LTLFAGFALFVYAIKLGIEYYREEILGEGDDDDDGDNNRDDYEGDDEEIGAGWCCCGEVIGGYDKVVQNAIVDETTDGGKGNNSGTGGEYNDIGTVRPLLLSKNVDDDDEDDDDVEVEESFDENNIDVIDEFDNEEELAKGGTNNDQCAGEISSEKCAKTKSKSSPNNNDGDDTNMEPFEIESDFNDNVQHSTNDNNNSPKSCLSATSRTLPIVAFLGSLDDLTLFVPMLVGKTFGIFELILGSIVAGTIIVVLCCFITKCEMISNFLMRIPMAVIVAVFSVILLVRGLNME